MIDLAKTPGRVRELVRGLDEARIRAKNGDSFSIVETVCHLRDIEAEGYARRIELLLTTDDPLLHDLDGDALARERRYNEQDLAAALDAFERARARSMALLDGVTGEQLARAGTFGNAGRITLAELIEKMREHDEGHLRDLAGAAGMPFTGAR